MILLMYLKNESCFARKTTGFAIINNGIMLIFTQFQTTCCMRIEMSSV